MKTQFWFSVGADWCGFLCLRFELIKGKVVVIQRRHSLKKIKIVFLCAHILSERKKNLAASPLNFHHYSSSCSRCSWINNHDTTEHVFLSRNVRALAVMPQLVA